jgi:hypothetical protein
LETFYFLCSKFKGKEKFKIVLNYATIIQAIKFSSNEGAKIPSILLLSSDLMKNFLLGHSRAGDCFYDNP